ncbi:MAG: hypothetical protein ABFR75_10590, partial [Acidobacteriota bacterium]
MGETGYRQQATGGRNHKRQPGLNPKPETKPIPECSKFETKALLIFLFRTIVLGKFESVSIFV